MRQWLACKRMFLGPTSKASVNSPRRFEDYPELFLLPYARDIIHSYTCWTLQILHLDLKARNVLLASSGTEGKGVTCKVSTVESRGQSSTVAKKWQQLVVWLSQGDSKRDKWSGAPLSLPPKQQPPTNAYDLKQPTAKVLPKVFKTLVDVHG
eukprot:793672-Pelagomonas_calceolata.AAC.2